jgi:hypothetical protein
MSAIQMRIAYEHSAVEIPCAFIDYYMVRCAPVYALIYIYSLRLCLAGGAAISSQEISRIFQILETDVVNAFRYWENERLIQLEDGEDGMHLTFLAVNAPETPALPVPRLKVLPAVQPEKAPAAAKTVFTPSGRPQYTVEELTVFQQQSKDIERLFLMAEQSLGKLLT